MVILSATSRSANTTRTSEANASARQAGSTAYAATSVTPMAKNSSEPTGIDIPFFRDRG